MPPANDNFANAIELRDDFGSIVFDITGSTTESREPGFDGPTVWFKWTATEYGTLTLDTSETPLPRWDSVITVFVQEGTGLDGLNEMDSNDDGTKQVGDNNPDLFGTSTLNLSTQAGLVYYIQVGSYTYSSWTDADGFHDGAGFPRTDCHLTWAMAADQLLSLGTAQLVVTGDNSMMFYGADGHIKEVVCHPNTDSNSSPGLVFSAVRNAPADTIVTLNVDFADAWWIRASDLTLLETDAGNFPAPSDIADGINAPFVVGSEVWFLANDSADEFTLGNFAALYEYDAATRVLTSSTRIAGTTGLWTAASWDNNTFYFVDREGDGINPASHMSTQPVLYRWTVGDASATSLGSISDVLAGDPTVYSGDVRNMTMRGPNELAVLCGRCDFHVTNTIHPTLQCFDLSGGTPSALARYEFGDMIVAGTIPAFYPRNDTRADQHSVAIFGVAADSQHVWILDEFGGEVWQVDRLTDQIVLWNKDTWLNFARRGAMPAEIGTPQIIPGSSSTNGVYLGIDVKTFIGYDIPYAPGVFRLWPNVPPLTGAHDAGGARFHSA